MALLKIKLELIKFWAIEIWKELSSLKNETIMVVEKKRVLI